MANKRRTRNTALIQCYVTPEEREALSRVAETDNMTVSAVLRQQLRTLIESRTSVSERSKVAA